MAHRSRNILSQLLGRSTSEGIVSLRPCLGDVVRCVKGGAWTPGLIVAIAAHFPAH
jgi:hypothetical protein